MNPPDPLQIKMIMSALKRPIAHFGECLAGAWGRQIKKSDRGLLLVYPIVAPEPLLCILAK